MHRLAMICVCVCVCVMLTLWMNRHIHLHIHWEALPCRTHSAPDCSLTVRLNSTRLGMQQCSACRRFLLCWLISAPAWPAEIGYNCKRPFDGVFNSFFVFPLPKLILWSIFVTLWVEAKVISFPPITFLQAFLVLIFLSTLFFLFTFWYFGCSLFWKCDFKRWTEPTGEKTKSLNVVIYPLASSLLLFSFEWFNWIFRKTFENIFFFLN